MTTTTNKTVLVNNKKYTITGVADGLVTLEGPRGGWASLVRNVHSGNWSLVTERAIKPIKSVSM